MLGAFDDTASRGVATKGIGHCPASEFIVSVLDYGNEDC